MSIRSELLALTPKGGVLEVKAVVEWARENPASAIAGALEWDDAIAAERYREWQVRKLIAVFVTDEAGERELISLSVDRSAGGYRAIDDISKAPDLAEVMLRDAHEELKRVREKYARVKKLAVVWGVIDDVVGASRKKDVA